MDVTRTTTLLLEGLHDQENGAAWSEFDRRYRPIVLGVLRALGVNEADASDVSQETTLHFMKQYREGRYDRTRGRLRNWVLSIARTQLAIQRRRPAMRRESPMDPETIDGAFAIGGDDAELDRLWEQERRQAILRESFARLSTESQTGERALQAFELLVFRAVPAPAVAEQLSMSLDDVYQAKSRVTARLRSHIELLDEAFDEMHE